MTAVVVPIEQLRAQRRRFVDNLTEHMRLPPGDVRVSRAPEPAGIVARVVRADQVARGCRVILSLAGEPHRGRVFSVVVDRDAGRVLLSLVRGGQFSLPLGFAVAVLRRAGR